MKGFNWVAAVCLVASVAGEAQAGERRTTIDLNWEHLPRRVEAGRMPDVHQSAAVKGATVDYLCWAKGDRVFSITLDNGFECSASADVGAFAYMTCGTRKRYFVLVQHPGKPAELEWIVVD